MDAAAEDFVTQLARLLSAKDKADVWCSVRALQAVLGRWESSLTAEIIAEQEAGLRGPIAVTAEELFRGDPAGSPTGVLLAWEEQ